MKSMSNRVTNNEISGKFAQTPMHQDLTVTLKDTPGYFLQLYNYLSMLLSLLRSPHISP